MIKHLPVRSGGERYLIVTDRANPGEASWKYKTVNYIHRKKNHVDEREARLEWTIMRQRASDFPFGFGLGFEITRDDEDPIKFALYLGPLASFWLSFNNALFRRIFTVKRDKPYYYFARQYGIQLWPYQGEYFRLHWGAISGAWSRELPTRSYSSSDLARLLFGRIKSEEVILQGPVNTFVPMPEGNYKATVKQYTFKKEYTKRFGQLFRKVFPFKTHTGWEVDIPGGIPHISKRSEMDGLFSQSWGMATSAEEIIQSAIDSVSEQRERWGPKQPFPRAMTVQEADTWWDEQRKVVAWSEDR